ncbi:MAG: PGPGW domain-containing protein [Nitrospirota bacterium]
MDTKEKEHFAITTLKQAKRIVIIIIGFTIVLLGTVMLALPGPGVITIVFGLAILGTEFVWARSLLKRFKDKANNLKNSFFKNSNKKHR